MSTIIFYAAFESEILHLARTNSCTKKFHKFITTLFTKNAQTAIPKHAIEMPLA